MKSGLIITMVTLMLVFASMSFSEVVVLFDEDAKDEAGKGAFAALFGSHDAGSTVTITKDESISGKVSVCCTSQQSYNPTMNGWSYSIDKYPYLTFAWKKDGGKVIMIQLAYNNTWAYRYHSGDNTAPGWASTQLDEDIPKDWVVYTRDLTKDFGKGWNLTGLALTPWDGDGYYDHILLHSEPNEGKIASAVEANNKLATEWGKIKQN